MLKRIVPTISSPAAIVGLSLPLILCVSAAVWWMHLPPRAATSLTVFRIFYAALIVSLLLRTAESFRTRSYGLSLCSLGLALALLHGVVLYGFHFAAKTSAGLDEGTDQYDAVDAGPWAGPPKLPIILKSVRQGKDGGCTLMIDGQEKKLTYGESFQWKGITVTLADIDIAPLFILSDEGGQEMEAGYTKLHLDRPGGDSFQFRIIPHEFYVSRPGQTREVWKKTGKQWTKTVEPSSGEKVDDSLHVLVVRGKLTLIDRDIKRGERFAFEGQEVRFEEGTPWVELTVKKSIRPIFLYAGMALLVSGCLMLLLRRRQT